MILIITSKKTSQPRRFFYLPYPNFFLSLAIFLLAKYSAFILPSSNTRFNSEIQLKVLLSINSDNKILIRGINNKYMICLLYLKKYDILNKYINENESFDYTKLGIYMTCKYHYNKKEYDELYDSLIKEQNEKHIIFIQQVNELLVNKTKKSLKKINEISISEHLYKFFENYAFS